MDRSVIELERTSGYIHTEEDVELFYRTIGAADESIVLLHGGPGFSLDYLIPDIQPLARNRQLILYDQRSCGRSTLLKDPDRNTIEDMVEDLEGLRRWFDLEGLNLLGHSWGALLAGLYAVEYPTNVNRMVLVGSAAPMIGDWMERFDPQSRIHPDHREAMDHHREAFTNDQGSRVACWNYWAISGRGYHSSPEHAQRVWGDICERPSETIEHRNVIYEGLGWPDEFPDLRDELTAVEAPTLVVHSEDGVIPVSAAETWAEVMPNAELFLLPSGGHLPWIDRPDVFFPAVDAFLRGVWPQPPDDGESWEPPTLESDPEPNTYEALLADIETAKETYAAALNEGQWAKAAASFTEDGMILGPSTAPVIGRRAIAANWEVASQRGFSSVDLQTIEVEGIGDRAFELGKYIVYGEDDQLLDAGKFMAHWRRTNRGWKLYRDIFNSSLDTRSPLEVPHYLPPPEGTFQPE